MHIHKSPQGDGALQDCDRIPTQLSRRTQFYVTAFKKPNLNHFFLFYLIRLLPCPTPCSSLRGSEEGLWIFNFALCSFFSFSKYNHVVFSLRFRPRQQWPYLFCIQLQWQWPVEYCSWKESVCLCLCVCFFKTSQSFLEYIKAQKCDKLSIIFFLPRSDGKIVKNSERKNSERS